MMYSITGITGKVGGELARTLLGAGEPDRAVVRDAKKGQEWAAIGCEIALAKMEDASALADAFTGAIAAFILPAKDVGRLAAKLIREDWTGTRIVELEGPSRITPHDLAQSFTRVIGKPVRAVPVPRESWAALFRSQGMRNPRTPHANALLQDVGLIHLFPLSFFLLPFLRCCSILLRIILQLQLRR